MNEVKILDYEEYYLIKENIIYKILIEKTDSKIDLKHKNYQIIFNHKNFSMLTKINFNTIDEVYQFIIDRFEDNKIEIKNFIKNKEMNLTIQYNDDKKVEIGLLFNKINKSFFTIKKRNQ